MPDDIDTTIWDEDSKDMDSIMEDEEVIQDDDIVENIPTDAETLESGKFTVAGELIVSDTDEEINDDEVIAKPEITPEVSIIKKHQKIEDQLVKDLMEHNVK